MLVLLVSIHQPNLFPWLGFFDKMALSDIFILLDNVPFTKGGYQNRVKIKNSSGASWLTIPVNTTGKLGQITNEVMTINNTSWRKKHLTNFQLSYSKCPGYNFLLEELESLYKLEFQTLIDFTIPGINMIANILKIDSKIVKASELGCKGSSSELLADLVKKVGGTIYLSGPSGKSYLDKNYFTMNGIEVKYHHFKVSEYPQRFGEFVGGLSTLDYLFNDPDLIYWRKQRCTSGS